MRQRVYIPRTTCEQSKNHTCLSICVTRLFENENKCHLASQTVCHRRI